MLEEEKGLTLIEVLVAAVILAVMAVAIAYMFGLGGGRLETSNLQRRYLSLAESKLEEVKKNPVQTGGQQVLNNRGTLDNSDDDLVMVWTPILVDDPANGTKNGEVDYYLWTVKIVDKLSEPDKEIINIKTMVVP
ncbi:MAG: type II secretion system protein [Candidatus Desulfofervidaceae bacterium]|nr:type II secretion system protein [Candidatus Desulfofervidaceae bacterium]